MRGGTWRTIEKEHDERVEGAGVSVLGVGAAAEEGEAEEEERRSRRRGTEEQKKRNG